MTNIVSNSYGQSNAISMFDDQVNAASVYEHTLEESKPPRSGHSLQNQNIPFSLEKDSIELVLTKNAGPLSGAQNPTENQFE